MTGIDTAAMISRIFLGERHAGNAAFGADLRGHALEGHHGDGAGAFGNGGLLGVGDVHDDAALEHFGEAGLQTKTGVGAVVLGHGLDLVDTFSRSRRIGCQPSAVSPQLTLDLMNGGGVSPLNHSNAG